MNDLVCIDPSIVRSGFAIFRNGLLIRADALSMKAKGKSVLERAVLMGSRLVFEIYKTAGKDAALIFEWPQIYDSRSPGKTKGQDPNDMLPLAAIGGAVGAVFSPITILKPREWKGQVSKPKKGETYIIERRVRKRLGLKEIEVMHSTAHDMFDAIGMGLWSLGRFEGRTYPRG